MKMSKEDDVTNPIDIFGENWGGRVKGRGGGVRTVYAHLLLYNLSAKKVHRLYVYVYKTNNSQSCKCRWESMQNTCIRFH